MAYNVWWLCVCLPIAQSFKFPQMLMGQIAQSHCYTLARLISRILNWNTKPFSFLF